MTIYGGAFIDGQPGLPMTPAMIQAIVSYHADPAAYPVFELSSATYPQTAAHVRAAQASGLPVKLSREMDPQNKRDNGNAACPASIRKFVPSKDLDCDEYPYRSIQQGAAIWQILGYGPRLR